FREKLTRASAQSWKPGKEENEMNTITLYEGDVLETLRQIPDNSADLVLTDPPYNIAVTTQVSGKKKHAEWDKIENYTGWCLEWLKECERILKPSGVLYFWHNDIAQCAELLHEIKRQTGLQFRSFLIWDKGGSYRAQSWYNTAGNAPLRQWFNICEYAFHFFLAVPGAEQALKQSTVTRTITGKSKTGTGQSLTASA
ncbi:MAG: hypothetical protein KBT02_06645, partial [Treponema sp.]|nr:hypothetical protein [Candidatus Treponema caballi]